MQETTKTTRMQSLVVLFQMHTDFFPNALEGITDEDAHKRLGTKANHIAWITGSLVHSRFELARLLGIEKNQEAGELFKDNKGIQDDTVYPTIEAYKKDWDIISPSLKEGLISVSDEKLDTKFEMMPGMTMSHFDMIAFTIYREANCLGQIALWRRLLGYEAMKYM
ncbi:MAG: DinB family protein [Bacteroidota bacterium]